MTDDDDYGCPLSLTV